MTLGVDAVSAALNHSLVNNPQSISGIRIAFPSLWSSATTLVGSAIEEVIADVLNRSMPDDSFDNKLNCKFPDIYRRDKTGKIVSAIEIKSWWIHSKEKKPCFRFSTSKDACGPDDIIVLVSWVFNQSGNPEVKSVFVENCHELIRQRNQRWCEDHPGDSIVSPLCERYGGTGRTQITDRPLNGDKGNNFGRLARSKIPALDEWIKEQRTLHPEIGRTS